MKKLNIFIWFISRSNIAHIGANVKKKLLRAWNWWSERGLNPQPDAYKAPALTIELSDHKNCSVFWGASYLSDDINPTVLFSHLQPHFHHLPPLSSFCILWHFIQLSHPIIISRSSFSLVSHIHLLIACTHFVCEWICQLRDYRKLKLYIVCVERTELTLTNITISQRLKKSTSFCTSGRFSLKFQYYEEQPVQIIRNLLATSCGGANGKFILINSVPQELLGAYRLVHCEWLGVKQSYFYRVVKFSLEQLMGQVKPNFDVFLNPHQKSNWRSFQFIWNAKSTLHHRHQKYEPTTFLSSVNFCKLLKWI